MPVYRIRGVLCWKVGLICHLYWAHLSLQFPLDPRRNCDSLMFKYFSAPRCNLLKPKDMIPFIAAQFSSVILLSTLVHGFYFSFFFNLGFLLLLLLFKLMVVAFHLTSKMELNEYFSFFLVIHQLYIFGLQQPISLFFSHLNFLNT